MTDDRVREMVADVVVWVRARAPYAVARRVTERDPSPRDLADHLLWSGFEVTRLLDEGRQGEAYVLAGVMVGAAWGAGFYLSPDLTNFTEELAP